LSKPLATCLCCTYGRPVLLGEAIKCFIDQDYDNKELIVLNDRVDVTLKMENCPDNIKIINYPTRFESLGAKRNYIKTLGNGDYYFIWDDDDLFTPWRIRKSIENIVGSSHDIVKAKYALMSINNKNYMMVNNLFHSQACIAKKYMQKTFYPNDKSVGEDMDFEKKAMIDSPDLTPKFLYVYRWGQNIHHLSGITDNKKTWEKSLSFEPYKSYSGEVIIKPEFQNNYWLDIGYFLSKMSEKNGREWEEEIKNSRRQNV